MSVTIRDVRRAARDLHLTGRPLCVHASLRSFGRVAGGPSTIAEGLLGEACTVLVPTFSTAAFEAPPPAGRRPERNGVDYDELTVRTAEAGRVYAPDTSEINRAMGAIPAAIVGWPGRVRGSHPLNSFAAVGPRADELVSRQTATDVYAPLRALAEADGAVALMGVGLNRMTLLHLAEQIAGRRLFRRWANGPDGTPIEVEVGGCSRGFGTLDPLLAPLMCRAVVGRSTWRVFPAREVLDVAASTIRDDPGLTRCDDPTCLRCHDAVRGGPIVSPLAAVEE